MWGIRNERERSSLSGTHTHGQNHQMILRLQLEIWCRSIRLVSIRLSWDSRQLQQREMTPSLNWGAFCTSIIRWNSVFAFIFKLQHVLFGVGHCTLRSDQIKSRNWNSFERFFPFDHLSYWVTQRTSQHRRHQMRQHNAFPPCKNNTCSLVRYGLNLNLFIFHLISFHFVFCSRNQIDLV